MTGFHFMILFIRPIKMNEKRSMNEQLNLFGEDELSPRERKIIARLNAKNNKNDNCTEVHSKE